MNSELGAVAVAYGTLLTTTPMLWAYNSGSSTAFTDDASASTGLGRCYWQYLLVTQTVYIRRRRCAIGTRRPGAIAFLFSHRDAFTGRLFQLIWKSNERTRTKEGGQSLVWAYCGLMGSAGHIYASLGSVSSHSPPLPALSPFFVYSPRALSLTHVYHFALFCLLSPTPTQRL